MAVFVDLVLNIKDKYKYKVDFYLFTFLVLY